MRILFNLGQSTALRLARRLLLCLSSVIAVMVSGSKLYAEPFVVGVSAPLSGDLAEFGSAVKNGMELARLSQPQSLSNIKFIYEDNRYEGKLAVGNFYKFKDFDHVNLIYVFSDIPALAVSALAEKLEFPVIATSTVPVTNQKRRFYIRFINSYIQYARAIANYLSTKGYTSITLLVSDDPYYSNYAQVIQESVPRNIAVAIKGPYAPQVGDFRSELLRIKSSKTQMLGLLILPTQIKTIFRQMRELKMRLPVFGADDFESNSLLVEAAGLMQGAPYALHQVSEDFAAAYRQHYGNYLFISYAANAYEFARLCSRAFNNSPAIRNPQEILRTIRATPPYEGIVGRFEFRQSADEGDYFHFPIAIKLVDGQGRKVAKLLE